MHMSREARACLTNATEVKALTLLDEAAQLAAEVDDQRAARAVLRVRARALRNVRMLVTCSDTRDRHVQHNPSTAWRRCSGGAVP